MTLAPAVVAGALAAEADFETGEAPGPNMVRNGSFERLLPSGMPEEWTTRVEGATYSIAVEEGGGVNGGAALRLAGTSATGDVESGRAHVVQKGIPVAEYRGKTLVLRGWYKGRDVVGSQVYLNVEFLNEEQNKLIAPSAFIYPPPGTTDWILLEREVTIPEEAVYVWINAKLQDGSGTSWWDEIELREGRLTPSESGVVGVNLFQNPTFAGAEERIPPPGWTLYGSLANGHRITVVDADDPERRALLLEDMVSIPRGNQGEIGLYQTVPVTAGRAYRATATLGALPDASPETTYLQLRFLPSNELVQIAVLPSPGQFEDFSVEGTAPEGTTQARVYLYTAASRTPKILVRQITLEEIAPEEIAASLARGVIEGVAPLVFDLSQAKFEIPPLEELRSRIPTGRPRLFARPETLEELRQKRFRSPMVGIVWRNIQTQALISANSPLPPVPPDARPGGELDIVAWRAGINIANDILKHLHALGFAYLITGDERYGVPGKELLLHVAKWDPYGTSGRAKNDEISMRLLYGMSRAYDWLHPLLTPEERRIVQESMRARGNDVYLTMRRSRFEETLLNNHLVRSMGFLGEAAIAFMGDFPEAQVWFDYVVSLFALKYPPWGGDDGGWSQGVSYWQSYVSWVLEFFDAFKIATGADLYQMPFFHQTGYFGFYALPPKSKFGAFGDHSDSPPSQATARLMSHFALVYKNPAFQWYASQISGMGAIPELPLDNFIAYVRIPESSDEFVKPEFPRDLPPSRHFADVGWVIMNVDMEDWDNNVHVKFKSSPYGSFNHSHAEQNSFIIEAYGSPLAISSGYYPWYGSPHHRTWTWESRSKNTILVNGRGQGVQSIDAKGRIVRTSFGSQFDYVLGDATQSYEGRVDRFWRHLWFVKPNLIFIYDQVEAPAPATYDWLLHTLQEMEVDEEGRRVRVPAPTAEMWVSFVHPAELTFGLTDQFTVPPEDRDAHKPNQWHLNATTTAADGRGRFLTVLAPRPASASGEPPLATEALPVENGHGAKVAWEGAEYTVAFRDSDSQALRAAGLVTDGAAVTVWRRSDAHHGLMLLAGSYVERDGTALLRSLDGAIDAGAQWRCDGPGALHLQLPEGQPATVEVAAACAPQQVVINGDEAPTSSWTYRDDGVVVVRYRPQGQ